MFPSLEFLVGGPACYQKPTAEQADLIEGIFHEASISRIKLSVDNANGRIHADDKNCVRKQFGLFDKRCSPG